MTGVWARRSVLVTDVFASRAGSLVDDPAVQTSLAAYLSAQYRAAIPLLLLIVVILFRPQGLLGRLEERTV